MTQGCYNGCDVPHFTSRHKRLRSGQHLRSAPWTQGLDYWAGQTRWMHFDVKVFLNYHHFAMVWLNLCLIWQENCDQWQDLVKDESWWTWPTGGVRLQPWGEEHLHQCSLPEHDWDHPRGASWPRMDFVCPPRWLARKSRRFKCCSWSQFCPCAHSENHRLALTIPNISEVWNPRVS